MMSKKKWSVKKKGLKSDQWKIVKKASSGKSEKSDQE